MVPLVNMTAARSVGPGAGHPAISSVPNSGSPPLASSISMTARSSRPASSTAAWYSAARDTPHSPTTGRVRSMWSLNSRAVPIGSDGTIQAPSRLAAIHVATKVGELVNARWTDDPGPTPSPVRWAPTRATVVSNSP